MLSHWNMIIKNKVFEFLLTITCYFLKLNYFYFFLNFISPRSHGLIDLYRSDLMAVHSFGDWTPTVFTGEHFYNARVQCITPIRLMILRMVNTLFSVEHYSLKDVSIYISKDTYLKMYLCTCIYWSDCFKFKYIRLEMCSKSIVKSIFVLFLNCINNAIALTV